jgi:hypothetical protein
MNIRKYLKTLVWSVTACVFLLFAFFSFSAGLHMQSEGREKLFALKNGERTFGTIVRDYESLPDSDGATSHVLTYRFALPSGLEIVGEYTDVDSGYLADRTVGSPIEVAYNPDKPEVNVPANAHYSGADSFMTFLALVLAPLAFLVFAVNCGKQARKALTH